MSPKAVVCLAIVLLLAVASSSTADVLWVPSVEYPTINSAIQAANPANNDEVRVLPDSDPETPEPDPYYEYVVLNKAILVTSWDPAIGGPNREVVIIDGDDTSRCVVMQLVASPGATLQGFTLRDGSGDSGGGVFCTDAYAAIVDCCLESCTAVLYGGGVYIESSSVVTLSGCTVSGNSAPSGGGICAVNSSLRLQDGCTISENESCYGGGIAADLRS